jgi:hypothetical protein
MTQRSWTAGIALTTSEAADLQVRLGRIQRDLVQDKRRAAHGRRLRIGLVEVGVAGQDAAHGHGDTSHRCWLLSLEDRWIVPVVAQVRQAPA